MKNQWHNTLKSEIYIEPNGTIHLDSPVIGICHKWYDYIIPKRLTLKSNPGVYKWLWWNFAWLNE